MKEKIGQKIPSPFHLFFICFGGEGEESFLEKKEHDSVIKKRKGGVVTSGTMRAPELVKLYDE